MITAYSCHSSCHSHDHDHDHDHHHHHHHHHHHVQFFEIEEAIGLRPAGSSRSSQACELVQLASIRSVQVRFVQVRFMEVMV